MGETSGRKAGADGEFVRRVLIVTLILGALALVGALLVLALDALLLVFAGGLFAVFLNRLARIVGRIPRLPYPAALAIVLVALAGAFVTGAVFIIPGIVEQIAVLFGELGQVLARLLDQLERASWYQSALPWLPGPENLVSPERSVVSTVSGVFATSVGIVIAVVLVLLVGIYGAAAPDRYRTGLLRLFPISRRERVGQVLAEEVDMLWRWTLGRLFSMGVIGVSTSIGLWLFGLPLPFALGTLAALLTFIPNIGPTVSLLPPVLIAFEQGPMTALWVAVFYIGLQLVESYLLTPLVEQHQIALPPVVTISAQAVLGFFTGILGLIVAVPLVAVVIVAVRAFYVEDVLGDRDEEASRGPREPSRSPSRS